MWNINLVDDLHYVIDFVEQGEERRRKMLPRLQHEPESDGTRYSSRSYLGAKLSEWLRLGELSRHVEFADGSAFKTGPHGEWITEDEFNTWRTQMKLNCDSLAKKR